MSFSIREPRTRVSVSERITIGIRKYYPDWLILLDVILIQSTLPLTESGVKVPTLAAKSAARMGTLEISLEQGGGTALPRFAFFFGDIFHISDVGARLGQDVV